jgi:hypothetical protein
LARDEANRTSFSGTAFPTDPTPADGQWCWRTDEKRLYQRQGGAWVAVDGERTWSTLTAMRAVDAAALVFDGAIGTLLGTTAIGDLAPTVYQWDADSSAVHDADLVVRPTAGTAASGVGRWLKVAASSSAEMTPVVRDTLAGARDRLGGARTFDIRAYGATGGSDDTTAIQAAIDAASTWAVSNTARAVVFVPRGTWIHAGLTLKTRVVIRGEGPSASTLKMKNSTNANSITGLDAATLWAGDTAGGLIEWGLHHLTIDGNKANNTSGHGVRVYGRSGDVENVYIINTAQVGFWSKWGLSGVTQNHRGGEAWVRDCYISNLGEEGIIQEGPNDSHYDNVFVVDASQKNDNAYDAIWIKGAAANARFNRVHVWRWDPASFGTKVARTAVRIDSAGCAFTQCHFEGMWTACVEVNAQLTNFDASCKFYAPHNGVVMLLRSSYCIIKGSIFYAASAGRPASKGIVFGSSGDAPGWNVIECLVSEQMAGICDWTNSGANNKVTIRGVNSSAGTFMVGTPPTTTEADIIVGGTSGGFLRLGGEGHRYRRGNLRTTHNAGYSAAGTDQATATALAAGFDSHYTGTVPTGTGLLLNDDGEGCDILIWNDSGNALLVYPPSGHIISPNSGVNTPISVASKAGKRFRKLSDSSSYWVAY